MKRNPRTTAPFEDTASPPQINERRLFMRQQPRSLIYVELEGGNGGIALNLSEEGLCLQAVVGLMDDVLPHMRFQLPGTQEWIETAGTVVWANDSRKLVGARFTDLTEAQRKLIQDWLERENQAPDLPAPEEKLVDKPAQRNGKNGDSSRMARAQRLAAALPKMTESEVAVPPRRREEPRRAEPPERSTLNNAPAAPQITAPPAERALPRKEVPRPASVNAPAAPASRPLPEMPMPTGSLPPGSRAAADRPEPPQMFAADRYRVKSAVEERPAGISGLVVFFVFLGVVCVAAGWAAGRGTLLDTLQNVQSMFSSNSSQQLPEAQTVAPSPVSDIEIVPANGSPWTVSLAPNAAQPTRAANASPAEQSAHKAPDANSAPSPVASDNSASDADDAQSGESPARSAPPSARSQTSGAPVAAPRSEPRAPVQTPPELLYRVDPVYPPAAIQRRVEGVVKLRLTVEPNGSVGQVYVDSGPPLLVDAATSAARRWRYSPATVDGRAVESSVDIGLVFQLP